MDPITLMLLTVVANAIVTGIIVYLIQKRIERSYTRQMEEFRANIQKSLFEHQIKFSKVYPKTLEVLEIYNQKIFDCSRLSFKLGYRIMAAISGDNTSEAEMIEKEHDELLAAARDIKTYFENNHLHLPDVIIDELEEINNRATNLVVVSMACVGASNAPTEIQIEHLSLSSRLLGISLERANSSEQIGLILLIAKLDEEFNKLLKRLEKLYKSVADIADKENE